MTDEETKTFDKLLSDLIEALGELANEHLREVEELSLESSKLRAELHRKDEPQLSPHAKALGNSPTVVPIDDWEDSGSQDEDFAQQKDDHFAQQTLPKSLPCFQPHSLHLAEEGLEIGDRSESNGVEVDSLASIELSVKLEDDVKSPRHSAVSLERSGSQSSLAASTSSRKTKASYSRKTSRVAFVMKRPWCDKMEMDKIHLEDKIVNKYAVSTKTRLDRFAFAARDSSYGGRVKVSVIPGKIGDVDVDDDVGSSRCKSCVIHPYSKIRGVWLLMCIVFLLYDIVVVPIDLSFEIHRTMLLDTVQVSQMIFWTADIWINFTTGISTETHVDMRPCVIARAYARSWLAVDAFLVGQEWVIFFLSEDNEPSAQSKSVRLAKIIRLLRIVRLVRLVKLRPMLRPFLWRYEYMLSQFGVDVLSAPLKMTFLLVICVHVVSCFWHALGDGLEDGWIKENELKHADTGQRYIISLRWTCGRLYGMCGDQTSKNSMELLLDAFLIFASLIAASAYIGQILVALMTFANSPVFSLQKLAAKYANRHQISMALQDRLMKFLRSSVLGGAGEMLADEKKLMQDLPAILCQDLLYEARAPMIRIKTVFNDMYWVSPRAVQHVCNKAMSTVLAMELESVFSAGDTCTRMLFVSHGGFYYKCNQEYLQATPRTSTVHALSQPGNEFIAKDDAVSEPALWTNWENKGSLVAAQESVLLSLDAQLLGEVLLQHLDACTHAVKYAKRFVWNLNRAVLTDLIDFSDLSIGNLDEEVEEESDGDHYLFISHYKVEAGTEAALMCDLLESMIREDPSHPGAHLISPVFIDSEGLDDLARLQEHVEKSHVLILLLTPGVFSRPWCVMELVWSSRSGVRVVPVEVQRPGAPYPYPDEEFYTRLAKGHVLPPKALNQLGNEGIPLEEIESVIRQLFQKIALPFSPHKSKKIRAAELQDILRRCESGPDKAPRPSSMSIFSEMDWDRDLSPDSPDDLSP